MIDGGNGFPKGTGLEDRSWALILGIELDFSASAVAFGPAPILVFLIAVVVDVVFAGLTRRLPIILRPAVLSRRLVGELARRLDREFRSSATRLIRGLILLLILGVPTALVALIIERAAGAVAFLWVVELVVVAALIPIRASFNDSRAAAQAIGEADLLAARLSAEPLVGEGAARMDRLDLSAALLRELAERINSGFVAAAFWFVLLGLPGLAVYWIVNITARQVTRKGEADMTFNFAATRFHDAVALIPAFFTGILIAISAAFVPQAHIGPAFGCALRWPSDRPVSWSWPGTVLSAALGTPPAQALDAGQTATLINRAVYLYALCIGLGFVGLALAALLRLSA